MKSIYVLLLVVVMPAVAAPADDHAPEMDIQVTRVTNDIHVFSCSYGRHYVNVTAFDGPEGLLLVDSGHKRTVQALTDKLKGSDLGTVTHIINTHHHGDHTGGNSALGSSATVIAHENVRSRLLDRADSSRLVGIPDSTFSDSLMLYLNGDTIRVIHLQNGHTDGDVIVHFAHANVVCMGDLLFADAIPHIFKYQGGSLDGFIENLGLVLTMFPESTTLIPGHGRVYTMSELRRYRDMLSGLTERVRADFEAGKEIDEVFAANVLKPWRDWVSQEFVSDSAFVLMVWDNDKRK